MAPSPPRKRQTPPIKLTNLHCRTKASLSRSPQSTGQSLIPSPPGGCRKRRHPPPVKGKREGISIQTKSPCYCLPIIVNRHQTFTSSTNTIYAHYLHKGEIVLSDCCLICTHPCPMAFAGRFTNAITHTASNSHKGAHLPSRSI
jgi:hypothetical protein